jgi:DNA-binding beta-propeller fold protein YncE
LTAEIVPLCDGWFLIAENGVPDGWRVVARNVLDGREGERFVLPGQPGALALDEARRILYAALPQQDAVAAVDLQTGALDQYPLEDPPMDLALDPLGNLFVVDDRRDLCYLPLGGEAFESGWPSIQGHEFLEWNAASDELVAGQSDTSLVGVARYSFDPVTGPIRLQWKSGTSSGGGVALSPDGAHIALALREDSGADRNVKHLDAGDLHPPLGEWVMPPKPRGLAFDPSSALLAVANETDALLFDVASYGLIGTLPVPGGLHCTSGVRGVAFSRGGRILVGREHCATSTPFATTRFFWRILP